MPEKNIVLIGAGYAGVHAAKKLAKKYKKDKDVNITLIDRHSYHTMMTNYMRLLVVVLNQLQFNMIYVVCLIEQKLIL